ncbi:hypothetical protein BC939DRAFT_444857 [Gamsiella multidivaricata]|uniref:uncharacterized protein n=1 Tax=Gamsiella multidivaricata TaxID=101098 RepID=UPI00221ED680|nr:uncharacterized protein BC939DRAFT_444857 [Gamsiella multidivaricata]KAG0369185.1 hypothetical protein BGZ54_000116 [Gamsiella multidivaricata]KAI7827647.1 hypothetical protein BC939DRAFT_444857 [Gamsiella multidivaricata]
MAPAKKHVVIIGAGVSGLAAAHELSKHPSSIQVTVLEARNRIGGRLDTQRNLFSGKLGDIPIDFGASWIHGVDPSNPLVSLAKVAGARLEATNSDVIYPCPGENALEQEESNHYWAVLWDIFGRAQEHSRMNRDQIETEISFKEWLDEFLATRQSDDPQAPKYMSKAELKVVPLLAQFWADENAIPLDKVSLKYMDAEDMPPGDHCIMADGYDRVLDVLCKGMKAVDIRLEHIVNRIEYNESNVRIFTNKRSFTADVVLVTLPLGVLKSNSVIFSPPLPERKQTAIRRLGFGTMVKVVMSFPTCFWPTDKHFINFLPIPTTSIPSASLCRHLNERQMLALTIYMSDLANYTSLMPIHGAPILIGYMANESAEAFEKLSEEEAMEVLVCQLSHYFDVLVKDPAASRPTRVFMTRWNADPYARGSYTSIPVGAHQSDLAEFEIPVGVRSVMMETSEPQRASKYTVAAMEGLEIEKEEYQGAVSNYNGTKKVIPSRSNWVSALDASNAFKNFHKIRLVDFSQGLRNQSSNLAPMNDVDADNGHRNGRKSRNGRTASNRFCNALIPRSHMNSVNIRSPAVGTQFMVIRDLRFEDVIPLVELDPLSINGGTNAKHGTSPFKKKPTTIVKAVSVDDSIRGRIHFAGEHTTPTSFASVHGALMTGRREAAKILTQVF